MHYTKEEILEAISNMSVIEINELVIMIEKKFNILYKDNIETDNNIKKEEEKNSFNIILKSIGQNKISVIKSIRSITNLGLKEAKDLVESCPTTIKENISKEESEKIKKLLEDSGAIIELV